MSIQKGKAAPANGRPANIDEFFAFARKRAPGALDYQYDEMVDGRPLRPGEMMRVVSLIRGDGYMGCDMESVETRCAAAFVAARIGLDEAIPALRIALTKGIDEPIVRYAIEYALECLGGMAASGAAPCKGNQLRKLLEMRNSAIPAERRLAEVILEKAAVKYGTTASW